MPAPDSIHELVEKFERERERFTAPDYNETQVRVEFINPLFKALGWRVDDSQEVVHEERVMVDEEGEMRLKHPDYAFRLNNTTRFFVEAKKPAVNLLDDPLPAFQVRRYGWSAKLPASILTDFEELIIYDCRIKPAYNDKPTIGRLKYCTYQEYITEWDELSALLSREAVAGNQLDEWVRGISVRGTQTVDDAFLAEMEAWRVELAREIANRNADLYLSPRDLNMAVQVTIDRIVFLRIAEDRDIEPYGRLRDYAGTGDVYESLKLYFQQADAKYNSGLFHFSDEPERGDPDKLTLRLQMKDAPLKAIINSLYPPDSPYAFKVLPADILGQVYERFLGKVIRLTAGGHAKVEEKPEVRKAGGVYYTPTYIVDYIVQNTVGRILNPLPPAPSPILGEGENHPPIAMGGQEGGAKPIVGARHAAPDHTESLVGAQRAVPQPAAPQPTPEDVSKLRILDPACGSGSFLIGAYQYLLDWHVAWYSADNPAKWTRQKRIRATEDGYALTTDEKKRILLNNIYGVDLDQQAVEVTKLSLLLKVLEGETGDTAQPELMAERVLPDLSSNIKWGNSLIGSDFYADKQLSMFEDEDLHRVKVFDWHDPQHGFGSIMRGGGFDVVIGNPPYIRIQTMKEFAPESVDYYSRKYVAASKGNYDIYVVFAEKGLDLLNPRGTLGFILPHKFFNAQYGEPLRGLIANGQHLSHVVHFGSEQVFEGATTYTNLLFLDKMPRSSFFLAQVDNLSSWRFQNQAKRGEVTSVSATSDDWNFVIGSEAKVYEKLNKLPIRLGEIAHIFVGTQTSADDIFVIDDCVYEDEIVIGTSRSLNKEVTIELNVTKPFLRGKQIRRYEFPITESRLICPYDTSPNNYHLLSFSEMKAEFPLALEYLRENKTALEAREKGKFKGSDWYAFGYPKSMTLFEKPKIIVPDYNDVASFTLDNGNHFYKTGYGILLKDGSCSPLYVLGILNTQLQFHYLNTIGTTLRGGYVRFWTKYIEQLPIRTIDFDDPADAARHDQMVELVERMLDLHQQLPSLEGQAQRIIEQQIAATDRDIDALVYELYDLTPEEITIVEGRA